MANSIDLIIERSDAKRQIVPVKSNSSLQLNTLGNPIARLDPRALATEIDFTEAWAITAVDTGAGGSFEVAGDRSSRFPYKSRFTLDGSSNNDKVWTVESAVYDSDTDKTTISVISTETVGATADGTLFPYDLILRPGVDVSVALDKIQTVLTEVDTLTGSPIFALERRDQTTQVLANAISLCQAMIPVSQDLRVASASLSNHTITNTYPMYLRRTKAATATTCTGKILFEGQSLE